MRACSYIAECSLSYTKIMQGERSSKAGKRSFTGLDIAEPKLILCKDNANESNESLLLFSRVQLIFCKDNASERNESLLLHCRVQLILCKIICLTTNV